MELLKVTVHCHARVPVEPSRAMAPLKVTVHCHARVPVEPSRAMALLKVTVRCHAQAPVEPSKETVRLVGTEPQLHQAWPVRRTPAAGRWTPKIAFIS